MLWSLTKWNHRLSTTRLVRWWLRMTVMDRFIIVIVVGIIHLIISFFTLSFWLVNWGARTLLGAAADSPISEFLTEEITAGARFVLGFMNFISGTTIFFQVVFTLAVWAFFIFFVIDLIWDGIVTRLELRNIASKDDVILATRGEYIGGHPNLPHSRFVYFNISGTQKNPNLGIILSGLQSTVFKIPLIDITGAKSRIDDKFGRPSFFNISLTSITPSIWKGYRSVLNVEYALSGRKYIAELGSFLRGNDEVQKWKNYLTCTQAEADTGEKPFGYWKSLPEDKQKESKK